MNLEKGKITDLAKIFLLRFRTTCLRHMYDLLLSMESEIVRDKYIYKQNRTVDVFY